MNVSKQSSIATRIVSLESAINRLFNCVCIVADRSEASNPGRTTEMVVVL